MWKTEINYLNIVRYYKMKSFLTKLISYLQILVMAGLLLFLILQQNWYSSKKFRRNWMTVTATGLVDQQMLKLRVPLHFLIISQATPVKILAQISQKSFRMIAFFFNITSLYHYGQWKISNIWDRQSILLLIPWQVEESCVWSSEVSPEQLWTHQAQGG